MYNIKDINDFTIKDYVQYEELVNVKELDHNSILSLYGFDTTKHTPQEMNQVYEIIWKQEVKKVPTKKYYTINGKTYKLVNKITDINAAQFIDYQVYMKNFKLEQVLSIFLLPLKRKRFGMLEFYKYGEGYDVLEVQDQLYNHMKYQDAVAISDFFLKVSQLLLQVMVQSSVKKMKKWEKKNKSTKSKTE